MTLSSRPFLSVLFLVLVAFLPGSAQEPVKEKNRNILFGMPGVAKAEAKSRDAYLISRDEYVLSYNDTTKTPNWVCWNLTKSDIGTTARGAFEPDASLPQGGSSGFAVGRKECPFVHS